GAGITIWDLIGMTFRKVNSNVIVKSKIMAITAGIDNSEISTKALEAHFLARGNVPLVIRALIAAHKAKTIALTFREATAIDLAGRNVLEAVQTSVYPKVIDCPAKGGARTTLDAVAKNGIQLKVSARVTVRANLQQLIGGATEETIIARVGEGIVSAIGSQATHTTVLENPDLISKAVLARRLDSQTAFEIVSIDIADIDVGQNIGARLQADRAEADTRVARARAEGRRAMAVAAEQEQIAGIEESRAKLVEAEAEVPKAMADAFRSGKLGIMDYNKLRNVQADTEMRKAIASSGQRQPAGSNS
ncbi:MAG: flotillin-like protein FloA, partial [Planctomycetales bacterium]|nr:flotillin-like protein FloA [Planctomycetales bacterium]